MHGPGPDTNTNPYGWEPTFKPPFRVVDGVAKSLGLLRRAIWRRGRDRALGMWQLPFNVEVGPAVYASPGDPGACIPGVIHLVRQSGDDRSHGGWDNYCGGGVAYIGLWKNWYKPLWYSSGLVFAVCHEVGHCLGLAHRYTPPDNHGVMAGDLKPDDHDITSLKEYYQT
jgi:hypothetical protein